MNDKSKITILGGAWIGASTAPWPNVKLYVDKNELILYNTCYGDLKFKPKDISIISNFRIIPFLIQGIRINHNKPIYKKKVVFWSFRNPRKLIKQIKEIGFSCD